MEEKLIELVADVLEVDAADINGETRLADFEQFDSITALIILSRLKEELGLDIPLKKASSINKVSDYVKYAAKK